MTLTPARRLALLAAQQFGVFTRAQAHDLEVSDRMLQTRVRAGTLERLSRDVFRIAGAPGSWEQSLLVAAWSGGTDCCVSHRAAAELHELDVSRSGLVEVVRQRDHQRQNEVVIADWTILRFTYADVMHRPEYVESVVRRALLAASA